MTELSCCGIAITLSVLFPCSSRRFFCRGIFPSCDFAPVTGGMLGLKLGVLDVIIELIGSLELVHLIPSKGGKGPLKGSAQPVFLLLLSQS